MFFDNFAASFDDAGVNEGGEAIFFLIFEIVANDNNALIKAELGSGHGGGKLIRVFFFPIKRSFDHLVDDFFGFGVDFGDLLGGLTQAGGWSSNNFHKMIITYFYQGWKATRRTKMAFLEQKKMLF